MNWDREPSSTHRFTPAQEPVVPVTVRAASPPVLRHADSARTGALPRRTYGACTAPYGPGEGPDELRRTQFPPGREALRSSRATASRTAVRAPYGTAVPVVRRGARTGALRAPVPYGLRFPITGFWVSVNRCGELGSRSPHRFTLTDSRRSRSPSVVPLGESGGDGPRSVPGVVPQFVPGPQPGFPTPVRPGPSGIISVRRPRSPARSVPGPSRTNVPGPFPMVPTPVRRGPSRSALRSVLGPP